ncbi:MAG: response regulator [Anaeromyxobacteraceae bacterium]
MNAEVKHVSTILLVDDSRVSREVLKVFLIGTNITVLEAVDGVEALQVIRLRRPDLVVADLQMPRLDGFGLCAELRADARTRETPVLVLTGTADVNTVARCHAAGAREVLTKPIQPKALLAAVARHLPISKDQVLRS